MTPKDQERKDGRPDPVMFSGDYLKFEMAWVEHCGALADDRVLAARIDARDIWIGSGRTLPQHVSFAKSLTTHDRLMETNAVYRKLGEMKGTNPKDIIGDTKIPLGKVPKIAIAEMAMVMKLGAKKYGPYNWRENAVRESVYVEAAMRHLFAAEMGETRDEESGLSHYAHAMACMAILIDAENTGNLVRDIPEHSGAVSRWNELEKL